MSDDAERRQLRRRKIEHAPYAVGYGKPPEASRFSKGQSGNPRGRPKGARNRMPQLGEERLKGIIMEEAYRDIAVRDGDRNVTVPMAQAIVRSMAVAAAKGSARAQKTFTDLLMGTEADGKRGLEEWMTVAVDYKIDWSREIERCKRLGLPVPDPIPHPDHIEVDVRRGLIRINGPLSEKEKRNWDWLQARKADFLEEREDIEALLAGKHRKGVEDMLRADIARTDDLLAIIDRALDSFKDR